ncbi:hypothetical protein EON64_20500, partial [archaeon]
TPTTPTPSSLPLLPSLAPTAASTAPVNLTSPEGVVDYLKRRGEVLVRSTPLPFVLEPGLLEIRSFGSLVKGISTLFCDFVCPVNYTTASDLAIALAHSNNSAGATSLVEVRLLSVVKPAVSQGQGPIFSVCLEKGTVVAEASSPLDAWQGVHGREVQVLQSMAGTVDRCRAVLNRLCISPDAPPFLDAVDPQSDIGVAYYEAIKAPMWIREVHSRLLRGDYESEFDFAWDVRLVFRNCQIFNREDSALYMASQRLSMQFETLFCAWVLNVVDKDVTQRARGPWDDWQVMQSLDDPANPSPSLGPTALRCCCCRDVQTLSEEAYLGIKRADRGSWLCTRCTRASAWGDEQVGLAGDPLVRAASDPSYLSSFTHTLPDYPVFLPHPETGAG